MRGKRNNYERKKMEGEKETKKRNESLPGGKGRARKEIEKETGETRGR